MLIRAASVNTSSQNDFYFTGHNVNLHIFLFGLTFSLRITIRKSKLKQQLREVFSPALVVSKRHLCNSTVRKRGTKSIPSQGV